MDSLVIPMLLVACFFLLLGFFRIISKVIWQFVHACVYRFTKDDESEWRTDICFFLLMVVLALFWAFIHPDLMVQLNAPQTDFDKVGYAVWVPFMYLAFTAVIMFFKLVFLLIIALLDSLLYAIRGE